MKIKEMLADKEKRAWILQDVANSAFATTILAVIYPLYYEKVLGQGHDASSVLAWWGYTTAIIMLLTAFCAPMLGAAADAFGKRKFGLLLATSLGIAACAGMGLLGGGQWIWGLILFALGSLGFSFNNVFYDAFLPHLAPQNEQGELSSAGYGLGYMGGGFLLLINGIFVSVWADAGARLSFISVALWWALFTIPFVLHIKEPKNDAPKQKDSLVKEAYGRPLKTLFSMKSKYPNVLWFLLAFWLYNDGIGTIMRMGVLYGSSLGLASGTLLKALIATQFIGVPFTLLFGSISSKFGNKKALTFGLFGYLLICCYIPFVKTGAQFWIMALAVGTVQGGTQAISRSLFSSLVPAERSAEFYGFYDLSSKFAGVLGPLFFGLLATFTGSLTLGGPILAVFFIIGILLLRKVKVE